MVRIWTFRACAQLAAAEAADDKPAIIELSRRMVEAAPQDTEIWSTLVKTQLETGDYDRCTAVLNAWETTVKPRPALIDDLRGDVAKARKGDGTAERCWRAYLMRRPKVLETLQKLAALCADQGRWAGAVQLRTRANRPELALNDCREAMKRGPLLMRARVQAGEALLDLGRGEEAAKLGVSYRLARDDKNHVSEKALRTLGDCDLQVVQKPGWPEPLVARAKALRALNQYLMPSIST